MNVFPKPKFEFRIKYIGRVHNERIEIKCMCLNFYSKNIALETTIYYV